jgi:hypothetical protein
LDGEESLRVPAVDSTQPNKKINMPIQLQKQPVSAHTALTTEDVQSIVAALSGVIALPEGESYSNVVTLNITIQPNGTGVLNLRFAS